MNYDNSTSSYLYTRIDGSVYTIKDPFPLITSSYINKNSNQEWSPEEKISWDELAPSLQELILNSRIITYNHLDDNLQDKISSITDLSNSLSDEINQRSEIDREFKKELESYTNLKTRVTDTEKNIININSALTIIQKYVDAINRDLETLRDEVDTLDDRIDQIERQTDIIWQEIWYTWGGTQLDWTRYKNAKWNIPHIWFDIWYIWSRKTDYEVYRSGDSFADTNKESEYEADYLFHKTHNNATVRQSWNIPYIWDELWWLWGGTNIIDLTSANITTTELANESIYNIWRNHLNYIYLDTDKEHELSKKTHNLNIPNIWRELWWQWNSDPDILVNTVTDNTRDYPNIDNNIWSSADTAREINHNLWRNWVNPATDRYLTIPNIWREFWYLWGGSKEVNLLNNESDLDNQDIYTSWRNHKNQLPVYYNDTSLDSSETVVHSLTIPNIWREIWWTWNADPDTLVFDTEKNSVLTGSNEWLEHTDTNRENDHNSWRSHKNPTNNKFLTIPNIWREFWYEYSQFPDAISNDTDAEADYALWKRFLIDTRASKSVYLTMPTLLKEIWKLWTKSDIANFTSTEMMTTVNDEFLLSSSKKWSIPYIWDEVYFLWGGSEAAYQSNRKTEKDIPHIWEQLDALWELVNNSGLETIWNEIYFIWGGSEAAFNNNRSRLWDIPHIWEELNLKLDADVFDTNINKKVDLAVYTPEINHIWEEINKKVYTEVYTPEINRIWAAVNTKVETAVYNLAIDNKVDKTTYNADMPKKLDVEIFNKEGVKLWAAIGTKIDTSVFRTNLDLKLDKSEYIIDKASIMSAINLKVNQDAYDEEINNIWTAINELRASLASIQSQIETFNGAIDLMRETNNRVSTGAVSVNTHVSGGSGCSGSCGGSCHSGTTSSTSSSSSTDPSKLLGVLKSISGDDEEEEEDSTTAIVYSDTMTVDNTPVYGYVEDDGNSGNCFGTDGPDNFGSNKPTGIGDYAWYIKSPKGNTVNFASDELPYFMIGTAYKEYDSLSATQFNVGKLHIYQSGCIFFKFSLYNGLTADNRYHYLKFALPLIAWPGRGITTVSNGLYVTATSNIDTIIANYGDNNYWSKINNMPVRPAGVSSFACKFNSNNNVGDNVIHFAKYPNGTEAFPYVKGLAQVLMTQDNFDKGYFGVYYSYGPFTAGVPKLTVDVATNAIGQYPQNGDDFWNWFKFNHRYFKTNVSEENEITIADEPITPELFGVNYSNVVNVFKNGTGDDDLSLLTFN